VTTPQLRVGIAGYGVVGKRRRQFIDAHAGMRTVAVSDATFGEDGVLDDGPAYFDDFRKLGGQDLDALFVCLPNNVAPEATIMGLERGMHVFCEKPPGRTVEDVRRVMAVEQRCGGKVLKYGFNHRYHQSIRDALSIVRSGELGRVINLRGVYGKSKFVSFGANSDWRIDREVSGGGILLDQGIHMVDLMRLFAGEFETVHSVVSNDHWNHEVEDNAYALMRTSAGVVALLHSSATQWRHTFQLDITLARGAITLSGILSGSKSYGAETMSVVYASHDDQGDPREITRHYDVDPSWADEIAEFAMAIHGDAKIENGSSLDALRTMELVYRIYDADECWRTLQGRGVGCQEATELN
jgi:predicted dehydrogenase